MVKVPIEIQVDKPVTKADCIMSLLDEGDICFKGDNSSFIFNLKFFADKEKVDFPLLKKITYDQFREFINSRHINKTTQNGNKTSEKSNG